MVALAKLTDIGGVTETALRGASVLVLEDELLLRKQVTAARTARGRRDRRRYRRRGTTNDRLLPFDLPCSMSTSPMG